MLDELTFTFGNLITISSLIFAATGLYLKIKKDNDSVAGKLLEMETSFSLKITSINKDIAGIICARADMWREHNERSEKNEAYSTDILQAMNEIKVDIKEIKTDLVWIKKK